MKGLFKSQIDYTGYELLSKNIYYIEGEEFNGFSAATWTFPSQFNRKVLNHGNIT